MRPMTVKWGNLIPVLAALCILLSLTACTSPKPQEQTSSPEVIQTQAVGPQVEDMDIPNQDVEFGD